MVNPRGEADPRVRVRNSVSDMSKQGNCQTQVDMYEPDRTMDVWTGAPAVFRAGNTDLEVICLASRKSQKRQDCSVTMCSEKSNEPSIEH